MSKLLLSLLWLVFICAAHAAPPPVSHPSGARTTTHSFEHAGQPISEALIVVNSPLVLKLRYASRDRVHYYHYNVRSSDPAVRVYQHIGRNDAEQTITLSVHQPVNHTVIIEAYQRSIDTLPAADVKPLFLTVVEPIELPPENTEEGLLVRLLLNEVRAISDGEHDDNLRAMEMMKQVLDARLTAGKHNRLLGRGINNGVNVSNYKDVIFAPGQFDGFATGEINARVRKRIEDRLKHANQSSAPHLARHRHAIEHATTLAKKPPVDVGRINASTLTHWRTYHHGGPAHTVQRETVGGNTFYSLTPQYIQQNRGTP